jgi:regulatory protein YycI of two-component signal transduction system YycFG
VLLLFAIIIIYALFSFIFLFVNIIMTEIYFHTNSDKSASNDYEKCFLRVV